METIIEKLDVSFDIVSDGDEKVFSEYFARYISEWAQAQEQAQTQQRRLRRDQMLGDNYHQGGDF